MVPGVTKNIEDCTHATVDAIAGAVAGAVAGVEGTYDTGVVSTEMVDANTGALAAGTWPHPHDDKDGRWDALCVVACTCAVEGVEGGGAAVGDRDRRMRRMEAHVQNMRTGYPSD